MTPKLLLPFVGLLVTAAYYDAWRAKPPVHTVPRPAPAVVDAPAGPAAPPQDHDGDPPGTFSARDVATWVQHGEAPATWYMRNGALIAWAPATQSVLIAPGTEALDGWAEVRTDRADDGGIVLRYVDESDYYLMALRDDASDVAWANVELYRRGPSGFRSLTPGGVDMDWPRGTVKTFRFEVRRNRLRAYADGALVAGADDATPLMRAGRAGLRFHDRFGPGTRMARYLSFRTARNGAAARGAATRP